MEISDFLSPESVIESLKARSKKQALQELASRAEVLTSLPAREVFDVLLQRERLGSTGVGLGVAIPHGKLTGASKVSAIFARLDAPIEFESVDDEPVDLIFLLIAPSGAGADHLKALARVSRLLRDPATLAKLRSSREPEVLYAILTESTASHAAA